MKIIEITESTQLQEGFFDWFKRLLKGAELPTTEKGMDQLLKRYTGRFKQIGFDNGNIQIAAGDKPGVAKRAVKELKVFHVMLSKLMEKYQATGDAAYNDMMDDLKQVMRDIKKATVELNRSTSKVEFR